MIKCFIYPSRFSFDVKYTVHSSGLFTINNILQIKYVGCITLRTLCIIVQQRTAMCIVFLTGSQ